MELELGGNTYKTGRLTPFQQFHIARRLAPALLAFANTFKDAAKASIQGQDSEEAFLAGMGPVADALANLKDEDTEYVLNACLGVCFRQQPGGWQKVSIGPGKLMFDDIDMVVMLRLSSEVIKENLANFMGALPG